MKKIYFLAITFSLVSASISVGQIPGDQLFDNSKIHEITIVSLKENLLDTLETNYVMSFGMNQIQTRDIPYTTAQLIIDGTALDTIGIRYKGFNSWWHSAKKPVKIDFNRYKPDQEYNGLKKINLHNGSGDPSFIRENIAYQLLRLIGIKAPRTAYAKVFLDSSYLGLYRIVEQIDNTFLDGNFGNHDGNLYKQQSKGTAGYSLEWRGENQELYNQSISLENHQNKNDWSDFIHFLNILNNTTDRQFRDSIRSVFDVDEYLQVLAVDIALNNLDYYGNSGRNYYLYNHDGKFQWIPWDYNLTWREGAVPIDINPEDYPVLTERILQAPEFYSIFLSKFCQLKLYLSANFINDLIASETMKIGTLLELDPYQDYPFEAFQKNLDEAWQKIPGLKPFAASRYVDIMSVLENHQIDCTTGNVPQQNQNQFELYPLPAKDWVNIGRFPNQRVTVSILNTSGQLLIQTTIFEHGKLDISSLISGSYLVKVIAGGKVYSKLLLVSR